MNRGGEMKGEMMRKMSHALTTKENERREAYCKGGFGLLAVGRGESFHVRECRSGRHVLLMTGERKGYAEEILAAYDTLGDALTEALRGRVSVAILDEGRGELILARGRRGKALYYGEENGCLVFSSVRHGMILPKFKALPRGTCKRFHRLKRTV